jgi:hypothetical protein
LVRGFWVTTRQKKTPRVTPHDLSTVGSIYLAVLVAEFLVWNIGFGQPLELLEYLLPIPVSLSVWIISRWRDSRPHVTGELDSLTGTEEMLRLIRRLDQTYSRKVAGLRGVVPAAQVLAPLWPILALILVFFFIASGMKLPFPSNLVLTTSLLALAISLLSMSWNFIETQSERIDQAFEKRLFDSVKENYGEEDHTIVRVVIRKRLKSGNVTLESVYHLNPKLFTRKALTEFLLES